MPPAWEPGKKTDDAVRHFRAILVRQPDAVRVRLELARAFYLKRDYENAFRQFQFARAGNLPRTVTATIDRFMGAIRREKNWSYSVNLAVAPDSNINNGTSSGEVILFGLPFELSDDTRRRSGVGLAIEGAAEFASKIGDSARMRLGAAIQRREYRAADFDDMTIAVHAGPRIVLNKWDLSVTATGFQRRFGGRRLNEGIGARLEATHYADARPRTNAWPGRPSCPLSARPPAERPLVLPLGRRHPRSDPRKQPDRANCPCAEESTST